MLLVDGPLQRRRHAVSFAGLIVVAGDVRAGDGATPCAIDGGLLQGRPGACCACDGAARSRYDAEALAQSADDDLVPVCCPHARSRHRLARSRADRVGRT